MFHFKPESYQTTKSFRSFAINYKHKPNIICWFYQPVLSNWIHFLLLFIQRIVVLAVLSLQSFQVFCLVLFPCRIFQCIPIKISLGVFTFFFHHFYYFVFLLHSFVFIFSSSFSYRWIFFQEYVKRCNNMSNYLPLIETWCNVCFKFFVHQTVFLVICYRIEKCLTKKLFQDMRSDRGVQKNNNYYILYKMPMPLHRPMPTNKKCWWI